MCNWDVDVRNSTRNFVKEISLKFRLSKGTLLLSGGSFAILGEITLAMLSG